MLVYSKDWHIWTETNKTHSFTQLRIGIHVQLTLIISYYELGKLFTKTTHV